MFCLFSFFSVLNSNVINILAAIFFLPSLGYFCRRNCEKKNYWFKVCVKYYSFWQVLLNSPSEVICQTDAIINVLLECLLEKAMAPHSSTLAWKIPWMEEPGRLQSMESLRVGHDWATSLSLFTPCIGEGHGNPLQCSCLENPRDGGAWWTAVYGVAQSRTRLKRLSSSSSNSTT